eukprot:364260-Chlamydomonas_euryale.AAC.11
MLLSLKQAHSGGPYRQKRRLRSVEYSPQGRSDQVAYQTGSMARTRKQLLGHGCDAKLASRGFVEPPGASLTGRHIAMRTDKSF